MPDLKRARKRKRYLGPSRPTRSARHIPGARSADSPPEPRNPTDHQPEIFRNANGFRVDKSHFVQAQTVVYNYEFTLVRFADGSKFGAISMASAALTAGFFVVP
ncbi:hypothetical protein FA15DRAFT_709641 [Coprinopsis marcescibilis]|uniref:Uncharacterized protein n=1 Tax=Coprinopsis marcescibilis TaxID=230819 RepID=A0A5C3KFN2_COPMA|nr:hypothetical protein FA15DRAFT_709641 [Coprinopsis marcescibilis]